LAEVAKRTVRLATTILLAPVTLVTALAGGALQVAGNAVSPHPYYYIKGEANAPREEREISLMTLNTCMFWGSLPMLFGGVSPAEQRVQRIADLIKQINPTVFAGQEVSFRAGLQLAKKLKHNYTHIFLNIAPNPWRLESCLFLAMRGNLAAIPYFKAFPNQNGIRRGWFCCTTERFTVITTHLTPGKEQPSQQMRHTQRVRISHDVGQHLHQSSIPLFLLGDLNCAPKEIPFDFISNLFWDEYDETRVDDNATCTNELTSWMRGKKNIQADRYESIDYALVTRSSLSSPSASVSYIKVKKVETFDLERPEKALSDHHGLLLTATLKS
ncbi:MAG: endonuclease/exonuclease/phosphatase family protein, partial [Chlamydiales bacterium]